MPERAPNNVTRMLLDWRSGNEAVLDQLMPVLYEELRRLAESHLRRERPDHTLQPTALIHEAYLRLVDRDHPEWQSRVHFFGVTSRLMRQILIEHARRHNAAKRGGNQQKVSLDEAVVYSENRAAEFVALDEALNLMATFDERKVRVIELRFFGGLGVEETAQALGISVATVRREMRLAEAWLRRRSTRRARRHVACGRA
ncbi:MAG: sigma-70 family RNA polymerase sigma factor [Blastocatellia bacterium]|nr:sigma-70 family RNA polymerase sigma factor [Blastocatellia bacterium]